MRPMTREVLMSAHKWTATIVEGLPGHYGYVSGKAREFVRDDGITVTYNPCWGGKIPATEEGLDSQPREGASWILSDGYHALRIRGISTHRLQRGDPFYEMDPAVFSRLMSSDPVTAVTAFTEWKAMQDDIRRGLQELALEHECAKKLEAQRRAETEAQVARERQWQLELAERDARYEARRAWQETYEVPHPTPFSAITWQFELGHVDNGWGDDCHPALGVTFCAFGQSLWLEGPDGPTSDPGELEEWKRKTPEELYGVERLTEARQHFRGVFRQFAAAMAPDKDVEQVLDGMGL